MTTQTQKMYKDFCKLADIPPTALAYTPTGFGKGRPRKGELRPATITGTAQAAYRAQHKDSPEWRAVQAMYQQFWYLANKDRVKQIKKEYLLRSEAWKAAEGKFSK